ncbi:MAG: ATP-binding protein [Cytophagales bacterium]|jgi:serine/threonine-protein kinase RsbW|nr:ATP-binding protein [Cytophagales bacterium]MCA6388994.1 ATP-binding protein [Cytophagales bacterium]MCA6393476.1 ATP-binding protein [Cytophagales bacterium]MCA6395428.1 ATP-binding protein [Cytophagales bacterium]MCA6399496.1 ATP-binding protein [Cytophagales bacterium]
MSYQYNIGCSLNNLKGVREFIRNSLKGQGVSELEMGAIVLALDEMCSNLMIHAHHCNPDHKISMNIHIPGHQQFVFEIIDDGSMFDINQYQEQELDSLVHEKRKGGLGIRLVKSIMDKVEYLREDGKNICRLTKTI